MIFTQRVVCFLTTSIGEGIENTQKVWNYHNTIADHERFFFLSHILPIFSGKIIIMSRTTHL